MWIKNKDGDLINLHHCTSIRHKDNGYGGGITHGTYEVVATLGINTYILCTGSYRHTLAFFHALEAKLQDRSPE